MSPTAIEKAVATIRTTFAACAEPSPINFAMRILVALFEMISGTVEHSRARSRLTYAVHAHLKEDKNHKTVIMALWVAACVVPSLPEKTETT